MITIAWDVDDVLNNLMSEWLLVHQEFSIPYDTLTQNPPHEILGISKEEYLDSLDEFRLSEKYRQMKPVNEIKQWFHQHGDDFRHIVVTAVSARAVHTSAAWVMKNFGRWIRTYHFVPSSRRGENLPLYDKNKQEALKCFNELDIFIDDSVHNLKGIDNMGIKEFLFPRPWNNSLKEVSEILEELTDYAYQLKKNRD